MHFFLSDRFSEVNQGSQVINYMEIYVVFPSSQWSRTSQTAESFGAQIVPLGLETKTVITINNHLNFIIPLLGKYCVNSRIPQ